MSCVEGNKDKMNMRAGLYSVLDKDPLDTSVSLLSRGSCQIKVAV